MKKISTLLSISFILLSFAVFSQGTLIDATVTSNMFNPQEITINVGDTVRWTNIGGNHNLNGTHETYPDNPESFGMLNVGSGWVYTHVFTVPGQYNYRCDPHFNMGMTGTVTVDNVTTIPEPSSENVIVSTYPNPASDIVFFDFRKVPTDVLTEAELVIFNATGKREQQLSVYDADQLEVNVTDLPGGLYLFQLTARDGHVVHSGKFLVR